MSPATFAEISETSNSMKLQSGSYFLIALALLSLNSCGSKQTSEQSSTTEIAGEIKIDGSSTVYPITEAVAEEFRTEQPNVKVTVGISGTGGGFKKFGRGEIDINDASRPIKSAEDSICQTNNIKHVQLKVAFDALVIVVNKSNTWVDHFTVEELKKIWEPGAQHTINTWNQIRADWPNEEFNLYGPGTASGTYDYFTEAIVGKSGSSRGDYTASEDDNVLVQGITGDKNGIGFFGLAYYEENKDKLKLLGVDNGKGIILPSHETVKNETYAPLARPIFIYVSDAAVKKSGVAEFINFYLTNAAMLVPEVGYIPLNDDEYLNELGKFKTFATPQ
jgi:phosphate transport system substrate-binding protein